MKPNKHLNTSYIFSYNRPKHQYENTDLYTFSFCGYAKHATDAPKESSYFGWMSRTTYTEGNPIYFYKKRYGQV
jgi:hypothetical protein